MTISVDFTMTVSSGGSPLIVGFTSTTTSSATSNTKKIQNVWDFGDSGGDVFGSTTHSYGAWPGVITRVHGRNHSRGRRTCHKFEFAPGTGTHNYTVTLYSEYNGEWGSKTHTVTVSDPDALFPTTSTVCLSPSGNFTGAPSGSTQVTGSDVQAFVTTHQGNSKRLLLHRGESYTCDTALTIALSTGQIHLGVYGSGTSKAYISSTLTTGTVISLSSGPTPDMSDVKFEDWELDGLSSGSAILIQAVGGCDQVHFNRVEWHHGGTGINMPSGILQSLNGGGFPGHHLWANWGLADCYGHHATADFTFHGAVVGRLDAVGSNFDNFGGGSGGATFRINPIEGQGGSLVECTFAGGHTSRQTLQIRPSNFVSAQPSLYPDGTYFGQVSITNCKITGDCPWIELITSVSDLDSRMRDLEWDGNYYPNGTGTTLSSIICGVDFLRRNNLRQFTVANGSAFALGSNLEDSYTCPPCDDIQTYGETIFESIASSTIFAHTVIHGPAVGSVTNKNVLAYSTSGTTTVLLGDEVSSTPWTGTYTAAGNTNNNKNDATGIQTSPSFVSGSPTAPADFKLQSGSNARGAGVACPELWLDFFGNRRYADGATTDDRGFAVYDETLLPPWESFAVSYRLRPTMMM